VSADSTGRVISWNYATGEDLSLEEVSWVPDAPARVTPLSASTAVVAGAHTATLVTLQDAAGNMKLTNIDFGQDVTIEAVCGELITVREAPHLFRVSLAGRAAPATIELSHCLSDLPVSALDTLRVAFTDGEHKS
jgi:hypothetical protein